MAVPGIYWMRLGVVCLGGQPFIGAGSRLLGLEPFTGAGSKLLGKAAVCSAHGGLE